MVDSMMVSNKGEAAFAGVSLVVSLDVVLITLFGAITSGGSVVLAQAMGRRDQKQACGAAKQLVYAASIVAFSFPFLAIENSISAAFRAQRGSIITPKTSLFMNLLNIGGNALLIYGIDLGAAGTALATLFSRFIGASLLLYIAHNPKRYIHVEHFFHYRPDFSVIRAILRIGVPNGT